MATPFAVKLLVSKSLSLGFGSFSWQGATFLFHLINTVFRNIQDPPSLFRLYHQQDLQSQMSIFPRCLISSHLHCPAHDIHEQWSPKDPMILGVASTLITEHTSWVYILIVSTSAKLLTWKLRDICPSGRPQMILHGSTLCTAVQLSYVIKHSKY